MQRKTKPKKHSFRPWWPRFFKTSSAEAFPNPSGKPVANTRCFGRKVTSFPSRSIFTFWRVRGTSGLVLYRMCGMKIRPKKPIPEHPRKQTHRSHKLKRWKRCLAAAYFCPSHLPFLPCQIPGGGQATGITPEIHLHRRGIDILRLAWKLFSWTRKFRDGIKNESAGNLKEQWKFFICRCISCWQRGSIFPSFCTLRSSWLLGDD